jgi:hypothetical protein
MLLAQPESGSDPHPDPDSIAEQTFDSFRTKYLSRRRDKKA